MTGRWEAIDPFEERRAGVTTWAGRAQITDGHVTESTTCEHHHADRGDAVVCGAELAATEADES